MIAVTRCFTLIHGHQYTVWTKNAIPFRQTPLSLEPRFPGGSDGKESAYDVGDPVSIPGLGRCPGEGNGNPLQYSCLENPMDGGVWWAAVHGVAKSWTWLSDFTFPFHFHALEKEMAPHSSVLSWRIPGTGESGGLPSMGSHRVGHDWSDLAVADSLKLHTVNCSIGTTKNLSKNV